MTIAEQAPSTDVLSLVFQNQVTEEGLNSLRKKYPQDMVIDMSDDQQFKDGRKTRTERNKLKAAIKERCTEVCTAIKKQAENLSGEVDTIYGVVVNPFEKEDKRRKEAKEKAELERKKLLDGQRAEIQALRAFITDCEGKSSQYIADVMESVDLLETSCFDKELIHEAIEAKKDVLNRLFQMQTQAKASEQLAAEKAELNAKQEAAERQRAIENKIADIRMIPSTLIGKSSEDINRQIELLSATPLQVEDFGDRIQEALNTKDTTTAQLGLMYQQQLKIESFAPAPVFEPETPEKSELCSSVPQIYTPLGIWPSAKARSENGDLDLVCTQLERAEAFIAQMADEQSAA
ncbi:hypothetical protein [Pseudoalteromonas rubra]|uniref:hypothetical protein n=1 Tax=Pseudoalteromonas rubra TaxID=43658 RepID=UPI000F777A5D|nr:hypothetical protein [Pseudoalteromonas rubra]